MRVIDVAEVTAKIRDMAIESNYNVDPEYLAQIESAKASESSPLGRNILNQITENAELASAERVPYCQDTGLSVVFADVGQDVHFTGGSLESAINEGVRQGYRDGYLRGSVVNDPLRRENTKDNTPAVIHYRVVPGDHFVLYFAAKGTGSENMSMARMLKPSDGREGILRTVVEHVFESGGNPCPPILLGIGLGGSIEKAAQIAKWSLFRPLGRPNPDLLVADLEQDILKAVNRTGVGPMGMGGDTTCVAVHIETYPCHIGALPICINVECHAHRHAELEF
ncbi:MAG: fumarate hydratase [Nitrospinota bacterium]|jgi:fumarate hydratase subunit alpha|nr:fumarate hydratase [Nitrospinota bacterium]MDP6365869.1 fumarate hydratase [Nitrospinota bacterium]